MEKERPSGVEKSSSKAGIDQQQSDFAYWQSRPYQERIDALEEIRREHYGWKYGDEPRLQRHVVVIRKLGS